jgi:three-Cys-motif partner protein
MLADKACSWAVVSAAVGLRLRQDDRSVEGYATGDCNEYMINELLPTIHFNRFNRALCLLDPYGLDLDWDLDWDVILQAGQSRAVDMFLNFPVMDMNRNAMWRDPDKAPAGGIDRIINSGATIHGGMPLTQNRAKAASSDRNS